jgi:hypothetical protein
MPYSSARPYDIPPDLPNNESIEDAFADTPEFAAAPNNDDDSTPESNEINSKDGEYAPSRRLLFSKFWVRLLFLLLVGLPTPLLNIQVDASACSVHGE